MEDRPIYNQSVTVELDKQVYGIENYLMPFVHAVTLQLETAWYVPGVHTEFNYYPSQADRIKLKSIDELKNLLIKAARWQYEQKQDLDESGMVGIALILDDHANRTAMEVYIGVMLYRGSALRLCIGNLQTHELQIETKDIGAISLIDMPRVFARVMLDMWCQVLENLPQSFPLITRQPYWFDHECYSSGYYKYPGEVWRSVIKDIRNEAVQKAVTKLKGIDCALLSGDDTPLQNIWEEICVQVQGEKSYEWEGYDSTIESYCEIIIDELPEYQQALLTHECETDIGEEISAPGCRDLSLLASWLKEEVLQEASSFSNRNIERYINNGDDETDNENNEMKDEEDKDEIKL